MKNRISFAIMAGAALGVAMATQAAEQAEAPQQPLGFFVTSTTHNGNLGGLAGADAECQRLATAVGAGNRIWRAYLSTHGTQEYPAVNARDRIGNGPWYNANNVMIAASVADLHGDIQRDANLIFQETAVTETGAQIPGRVREEGQNNEHDMLTGSDSHGRAFPPGLSNRGGFTCNNWKSDTNEFVAMIGHHDRQSGWNVSWNSSHLTQGCSLEALNATGGAGRFYCFAAD